MDGKLIAELVGLGGIVLAALLSAVGYFLKVTAERKKSAKKVLFYLLEIRHSILSNIHNPDDVVNSYIEAVKNYFMGLGINADIEMPDDLKSIIHAHFENILGKAKTKIDNDFIMPYEESLLQLSMDYPVLAYKLKGRERIGHLLTIQDEYTEDVTGLAEITGNEILSQVIPAQMKTNKFEAIDEIMFDLNNDILLVAKKCGFITFLRCRKILKKPIEKNIDFTDIGLEKHLDQYIKNITDITSKQQT